MAMIRRAGAPYLDMLRVRAMHTSSATRRGGTACGVGFEDTLALIRKRWSKSGIHPATLRLVALVQCLILWKLNFERSFVTCPFSRHFLQESHT
jgi:hypothetical protein